MPSKYGKEYKVPTEFPSLLKAFTREVLRAQPDDIYEFGSQYFSELLAQAAAAQDAASSGVRRLTPAELQELLQEMFIQADADNSGALSPTEFKEVLKMADLGLGTREVQRVMAEADFNSDGEISYEEFIPLAVDLVQSMYAKMEAEAAKAAEEEEAREEAKNYLLHGMTKEQVEQVMTEIFQKSDADGSGALSVTEFQKCCKDADIGLTRKEINILMHQCDVDGDGTISYEEFIPLCFEMLTEILKDELLMEKRSPSELEVFLLQMFQEADGAGMGTLDPLALKDVLRNCDFGLTRLQIHSILAEGDYDEEGQCNYMKFAPKAADLIYRMLDMDAQMERYEAIQALTEGGGSLDLVKGMSEAEVTNTLTAELQAADSAGSGILSLKQVQGVLAASSLGLTSQEVQALVSACDMAENGVDYMSLASFGFYILQYLAGQA